MYLVLKLSAAHRATRCALHPAIAESCSSPTSPLGDRSDCWTLDHSGPIVGPWAVRAHLLDPGPFGPIGWACPWCRDIGHVPCQAGHVPCPGWAQVQVGHVPCQVGHVPCPGWARPMPRLGMCHARLGMSHARLGMSHVQGPILGPIWGPIFCLGPILGPIWGPIFEG